MNNLNTLAEQTTPQPKDEPEATSAFRFRFSAGFANVLEDQQFSLLVTTYQAGKLMAVRARGGRVSTLLRTFERPMGLAVDGGQVALGTRNAIWFLRNAADIAPQLEPHGTHDACFSPRQSHITGDMQCHEMAWGKTTHATSADSVSAPRELWAVNTRFSCLTTLHPEYSFVPRWRPPFVSTIAAEDRCHLNGLAMADGKPQYVTALGRSDEPQGWRPNKVNGGILIDVPSGEVVAHGLSMPHSPRCYAGRLWVLDSGEGELQVVEPATGKRDTVARLPGFTRGLAFHGKYAFVGLSKIREKKEFGGVPIESRFSSLECGVWVVNVETGAAGEFMAFEAGCEEVFAVEVLPGIRWPAIIGFQQETINGVFVVPPI